MTKTNFYINSVTVKSIIRCEVCENFGPEYKTCKARECSNKVVVDPVEAIILTCGIDKRPLDLAGF